MRPQTPQPTGVSAPPAPTPQKRSAGRSFLAFMQSAGIFICVLVGAIAVAVWGGATAGERERQARATATTSAEIQEQFNLAMLDLQQGNVAIAAERLRWIVSTDPNFPGAADALSQTESLLNITATAPATAAVVTGGSPEELFAHGQSAYQKQDWATAIRQFQELQALQPDYRADEVKSMLYEALVTLGLQYVRSERLEEGLFLLEQAEQIKPLDDLAAGERNLARLYLTGRQYEGFSWSIAISNYEAIYTTAPDYRDVEARLHTAYITFADQLVILGGHCDAANLYNSALLIKEEDPVKLKADAAALQCAIPTPNLTPGAATPSPSPSP